MVIGLGFGDEKSLNLGTWELLKESSELWLRTEQHPVVEWIRRQGISFQTFDSVYRKHTNFEQVYEEIVHQLIKQVEEKGKVVYAIPGHPMVAERTVQLLQQQVEQLGILLDIRGGGSFLDVSFARLGMDPIEGFQLLDGNDLQGFNCNPRVHLLIGQVYDRLIASDVKLTLMEVYPEDHKVQIATALGIEGMEEITEVPLFELDHHDGYSDLTSVYVPPLQAGRGYYRRFDYLTQVIETLRSPEGCPWDREQTHESLRKYLIEESYEVIEAINEQDDEALADELGDVLLQVLLHAQIGKEEGSFEIADVIEHLTDKMIRRHPHVFGNTHVDNAEQVLVNWAEIKKQERGEERKEESILSGIPKSYPNLLRAYEIQKKVAKVGFDWESVDEVVQKVLEELNELQLATHDKHREEEMGDLLFAVVNLARFVKVDPEQALLITNNKFQRRFSHIEQQALKQGIELSEVPMNQLDAWWNEAKELEKLN